MTDAITQIKEYIRTPEGSEWFMNAVKDAQQQIQGSEDKNPSNQMTTTVYVKQEYEKFPELKPTKTDRNIKQLLVSRRELANVIHWTEEHPNPETDGRYIMRVVKAGERTLLKSTLLMKGESVSSSQLITDDPKMILSGDCVRVKSRGAHIETYSISLID